ncbi:MAG: hypothetical protein ACLPV4_18270 [Solirubrobacteraceae bacterium]
MSVVPQPPTGNVFRVDRARGPVWYAKYRLPDGLDPSSWCSSGGLTQSSR